MGIFTTTIKEPTIAERVGGIVESRDSYVSMFEAVKEGLEQDNEENEVLQKNIEDQISLLQGSLTTLRITEEKNKKTIQEITKFI